MAALGSKISLASSADASRIYKTKQFSRDAEKRGIADAALCAAMKEVMAGKADALGGGVYKKRLNDNMDRAIILAKGARHWIFVHLFQKNAQSNIDAYDLRQFKALAKLYASLGDERMQEVVRSKELLEICNDIAAKKTT